MLIDPQDYDSRLVIWEAVYAYEEAFALDPDNITLLRQQLTLLVDLVPDTDEDLLWANFAKLVEHDETGDQVRTIVDLFYNIDDPEPGIAALEKQIAAQPERPDLYINLALVYINLEEADLALDALQKAENLTEDDDVLADIDRLYLMAEDSEFEARLAEISTMVDAGQSVRAESADFLEDAVERAPSFVDGYVLLGKIYRIWGEIQDALDILLDGHKQLPDDPDIIEVLAQILWDSGENELAFEYLNKGVEANPNHVPLLALTGLYLFEDGQEDMAKTYLSRAEALSPRHPVLSRTRQRIAQIIASRD